MEPFRIRTAVDRDAVAIAKVHVASRRAALPYVPDLHTDEETRAWIANIVLPGQRVWVAEVEGQVVGYAAVDPPWLEHLYVLPGWHGLGIGSALLARARELSPHRLTLWTFQRNDHARAFYEKRGFAAVEFTDGTGNEEREPDVRYEWISEQPG